MNDILYMTPLNIKIKYEIIIPKESLASKYVDIDTNW